ncbi:MAG: UDP-N-acetylmuramate dehydrogenase [Clostridia bacterium]|nr:UDP-N-acetylmuramate dehydrogenase [Clostridia bacterium]
MNDVEYKENVMLAAMSPIRIGNEARFIAYPNNIDILTKLVRFLEKIKIRYKILGRMSNVLPPDEKYDGIIVKTDRISKISVKGRTVVAFCGASMPVLGQKLCSVGLSGFEPLSGIPGSIGGAILGNAGAFGREVSDLVSSVSAYHIDSGTSVVINASECEFGYRNSFFKNGEYLILAVKLDLSFCDEASIKSAMNGFKDKRRITQPIGKPSLGSTFKRPSTDVSAAKLIDDCGLKGFRIGDAVISAKHAGFIVNDGCAKASDYLSLADFAAERVKEKYNVFLEREIEVL